MAFYKVSARNKKSTIEKETWVLNDNPNKFFYKEIGWRGGSFIVSLPDDEHESLLDSDEDDEFYPYSCRYSELIECWDGCWEDFEFSENLTEEEKTAITEAWEENGYDGLEELGYCNNETDIILVGPLEFTEEDGDDSEYAEEEQLTSQDGANSFLTLAATLAQKKKEE